MSDIPNVDMDTLESSTEDFDRVSNILSFDPFDEAPADEETPAPSDANEEEQLAGAAVEDLAPAAEPSSPDEESTDTTEQATKEGEVETEGEVTTPDPEPAPTASPELELLKAQNAQLLQALQNLQGPGKGDEEKTREPDSAPSFDFDIPDQLQALLDSENPAERKQGLAHFAKGIAKYAYDQAAANVTSAMQTQVPQTINQVLAMKSIFEDFYGTYPDLNKPELYGTISTVGDQISKETGMTQWGPQLKKLVADRVYALLGRQGGNPPAAPKAPAKPATPNLGVGSGARPVSKSSPSTPLVQEVADTLFG